MKPLPQDVEDAMQGARQDPPEEVRRRFEALSQINAWRSDPLHPALCMVSGDCATFEYMTGSYASPNELKFFWKLVSFNGYKVGTTFANLRRCTTGGMFGSAVYQMTDSLGRLFSSFQKAKGGVWRIVPPSQDADKSDPLFILSKKTKNLFGGDAAWKLHRYDSTNSAVGEEVFHIINLGEPNSVIRYFYSCQSNAEEDAKERQQFLAMAAPGGRHGLLVVRGEVDAALILASNSIIDTMDSVDRAFS